MNVFILLVHVLICTALFFVAIILHQSTLNLKKREVKPRAKKKAKTLDDVRESIFTNEIFNEKN